MEKMNLDAARATIRNYFPEAGKPFLVELSLVPSDEETELNNAATLLKCMMNGTEIIPGVKVTRCYRKAETLDSLKISKLSGDAEQLFQESVKLLRKLKDNVETIQANFENAILEDLME